MRKQLLLICFAASVSLAQVAPTAAPGTTTSQSPAATPAASTTRTPESVPANAPIITLHGLCPDKPAGTDPKSAGCETIVTRAEFEHLANTLSPNMPAASKQSLANDYARMLVISNEARKRGLENSEHYKDLVNFLKMQLLAQELFRSFQDQAKPSPAEVEQFYNQNASKYEQLSLKRLFIPRNRAATEGQALQQAGTSSATPQALTDTELQAQAEKTRAQLIAGGDFIELQKEVYTAAGYKTPPPPTDITNWRRDAVPPSEQQLFELMPKEFSKVMVEPAGAYIYQLVEKKQTPLSELKPQIEANLTQERLRKLMDGIMANVKPEVNQAYFRSMSTEGAAPATPK